ncbi:MAG: protein kinase [Candidatus Melainabacteria bacterium]|nr:protein kinase [Candidatus Melainabacteria bacterium]
MQFDEKQQEKLNLRVGDEQDVTDRAGGETVDSFVLGEVLGTSSQGTSYKARDNRSATEVFVKVLEIHSALKATFEKRLKIELDAARNLSHPSIVPTLESGQRPDGAPYVVTEYLVDPSLFDVLHSTSNLTKTQILGYLIGACEAYAHAHEMGVVHRKISSRKIFVSSTTIDGTRTRTTGYGTGWIGDSRKADPRIDVLAFGQLIEEAFMGKSMPPEVQNIVAFCTAEQSAERYIDCGEVLTNLLLVNEGKLPNPPKNRTGQSFMKPLVVAAVVFVTIVITALAFNFLKDHNFVPEPRKENAAVQPIAPDSGTRSDIDPEFTSPAAVQRPYNLPSPQSSSSILNKDAVKTTAAAASVIGAAKYESMSADEKAKLKHGAVDSAKSAFKNWQAMDESSKDKWKGRAAGAAGKAASIWKKLPRN